MRVPFCLIVISGALSGAASAQDVCGNIRLSVAEQIDCRARISNALGDADRQRTQQEYEDRIRRANDALITPPVRSNPLPPISSGGAPNTPRPIFPRALMQPEAPEAPGGTGPVIRAVPPAPGTIAPGRAPAVRPLSPDVTAPEPGDYATPPISPLPANPAVMPPR